MLYDKMFTKNILILEKYVTFYLKKKKPFPDIDLTLK